MLTKISNPNNPPLDTMPWIEKYRPMRIKDMVQAEDTIKMFNSILSTGSLPHMLFYGPQGTGKTSSALALGRELFGEENFRERIIEFNASDDRGINAVREKISFEARKNVDKIVLPDGRISPPYKIIILDEADSMTDEAQDALRVIIEEYSRVTRFFFICNYINKMTDAIKSRCSKIYFRKLSVECMKSKLSEISKKEGMDNLSSDVIATLINVSGGDMRKAIMLLQNLKYEYDFRNYFSTPFADMTIEQLKLQSIFICSDAKTSLDISKEDIYEIAGTISEEKADTILQNIHNCSGIREISSISKNIINMGYPIDSIIMQLNNQICLSKDLTNIQKATILQHNSAVLYRMKECANEYIQLLQYLSKIYMVFRENRKPVSKAKKSK